MFFWLINHHIMMMMMMWIGWVRVVPYYQIVSSQTRWVIILKTLGNDESKLKYFHTSITINRVNIPSGSKYINSYYYCLRIDDTILRSTLIWWLLFWRRTRGWFEKLSIDLDMKKVFLTFLQELNRCLVVLRVDILTLVQVQFFIY